ncbi:MAG: hypothetical protein AB7O52_11735 [Planctomycetota bacterium]
MINTRRRTEPPLNRASDHSGPRGLPRNGANLWALGFLLLLLAPLLGGRAALADERELEDRIVRGTAREGLVVVDEHLARWPQDRHAQGLRNQLRVALGEFDPLLAELAARANANPNDPLPSLLRAALPLAAVERVEAAREAWSRAPADPDAAEAVVRALVASGDLSAAEQALAATRGLLTESRQLRLLASLEMARGNLEAADKALRTASTMNPDDAETQRLLAELCRRLKRWLDAERAVGRALFLAPARPENYATAARIEYDRGRLEEAIEVGKRGLGLLPQNADLLETLTRTAIARRDLVRARQALAQLAECRDAEPQRVLALSCAVAWETRDTDGLARNLGQWRAQSPPPSASQTALHRGRLAYLQDDLAGLREVIQEIATHADNPNADRVELERHASALADSVQRRASRNRFITWIGALAGAAAVALVLATGITRRARTRS